MTFFFYNQLEFSVLFGSIAAALTNFGGSAMDGGGGGGVTGLPMLSAWVFTAAACAALLYSLLLYLWRVDRIRRRVAARYHERYGPTALCAALLLALGVNFWLGPPSPPR